MEQILHVVIRNVPYAATIWIQLLILAAFAAAGLFAYIGREYPKALKTIDDPVLRHVRLTARTERLTRQADELTEAAALATELAQRHRAEWLARHEEVENAWQTLEAADAVARRLSATAAFRSPRRACTPADYADRERYLHQAVMAACARGELSALELTDALSHREGWDPRRHPVEQELRIRRAVHDNRLADHRRAVEHERTAWEQAQIAAATAQELREKAFAAQQRTLAARKRLISTMPKSRRGRAARLATTH